MKEISTHIDILASAEQVWAVLTDFDRFREWNPFIVSARGEVEEGEHLEVRLRPAGRKPHDFRPRITQASYPCRLSWTGHLWLPGLLDGRHDFEIEPRDGGRVRFVQRERFTGLLLPLLWRRLGQPTREGFESMNRALKRRCEAGTRS